MPTAAKADQPLSSNRLRTVTVSKRNYRVPRYIVRSGLGWQVRFQEPTKYFADSIYSSTTKSLTAAKDYLKSIWQPEPIAPRKCPPVRFIERSERKRPVFYAEVSAPSHGMAPVRIYIGTAETATKKRRLTASLLAKQAWANLIAQAG